jgi:hypothetical protein
MSPYLKRHQHLTPDTTLEPVLNLVTGDDAAGDEPLD